MKYKNTLALLPTLILAACGGSGEQTMNPSALPGSVIYSYPADGQTEVSPKARIVLRFNHAITDSEAEIASKIRINGQAGQISVTKVDNGRSLELTPATPLTVATDYVIDFGEPLAAEGGRAVATPNAIGATGIQFTTRAGNSGSAGLDSLSATFKVDEMIPAPGSFFRPMDFSTFRLRMTQPVHPEWQAMGGSVALLNSAGEAVSATVLVKERYITLDPCTVEDKARCGLAGDSLNPGETYTLKITALPSLTGSVLDYSVAFLPRETSPTVTLFQETVDSGLLAGTEPRRSILNGQIINGVTLNSVLQGVAGPSQQTGGLYAELAYAPSFPGDEPVPLRVPKGSLLSSSSLDVRINGTVPVIDPMTNAIQRTGEIRVTMLSDATGYLYPNPYSNSAEAPRHVKLFMDVSMNTEEAQPNASLSQDLLGVELSGIAIVKNGVLTIDAIGMVEPNLLGQEFTDSTIAFHIEANTNADVQLDALDNRPVDTTGPQLVSWMPGPDEAVPGNRDQMHRPGDPIVLNFDEPLDGDSLAQAFTLYEGGSTTVPVRTRLDGTTVAINPAGGLRHGVEYSLNINTTLTDVLGNGAASQTLTFALPALSDGTEAPFASPIALTTYPGYPCVTEGLDLPAGSHGTCVDAAPAGTVRDQLPVTTLPEDRPIVIQFSQSMDLATIDTGTFVVEKISDPAAPGNVGTETAVSGRLNLSNQRVRFYPDTAWEVGATYRYTLKSAVNGDCASGGVICSADGLPLDTDLLLGQASNGGPDMSIYFTGTDSVTSVFTPLRNLPIRDTNSNYVIDCATPGGESCLEPFDHPGNDIDGYQPSANAAKLGVANQQATVLGATDTARVGCPSAEAPCPRNKFIYQTYGLDTEVIGPAFDESGNRVGVRVLLYPTMLVATSASVFMDSLGEQATGPQILRMTYGTPTEDNPLGLVEGVIVEGSDGRPHFRTVADLTLDAPDLTIPLAGVLRHNLYSYPFSLVLDGPITFFDDGRMQIEQRNENSPGLDVLVTSESAILDASIDFTSCIGGLLTGSTEACDALLSGDTTSTGAVRIPLQIPVNGVYLNFLSNPVKEIPEQD